MTMEIIRIPRIVQQTSKGHALRGKSIGFVPTMGALHKGHLSLVRTAREENDIVCVSIFVNPLQFGPHEDLRTYPRDPEGDMEKLRAEGADILFMPEEKALYHPSFATHVTVGGLSDKLCGAFRQGHFTGVATIVCKLFHIVMPTRAYFGQKDFQQTLIVRRMAEDLDMDPELVVCPTVREEDGLAMSSRNAYLDPGERMAATVLYKALSSGADLAASGAATATQIRDNMHRIITSEPLVSELQYAGVYDPETLDPLDHLASTNLLAVALKIGSTRLIDNMLVERPSRD
jgi:pantoate--beta-alanine ligase